MMNNKNIVLLLFATSVVLLMPASTAVQSSFSQTQNASSVSPSIAQTPQTNATMPSQSETTEGEDANATQTFTINDSQTFLLAGQSIPEANYLHLYDSAPNTIISAYIAAKFPCNDDSTTDIIVLIGPTANVQSSGLERVPQLSEAGELCLYKGDLISNGTGIITDIALFNNSTDDIVFPPTSSVIVNVNEVAAIPS